MQIHRYSDGADVHFDVKSPDGFFFMVVSVSIHGNDDGRVSNVAKGTDEDIKEFVLSVIDPSIREYVK